MEEKQATCSNPGCNRPGTKKCSSCNSTPYCGATCQTEDWPHHREECPGQLLKVGTAQRTKAVTFYGLQNWPQVLRHCDLALVKLKMLTKNRPLQDIDDALNLKVDALKYMGQYTEALESVTERYQLWAMGRGPAHPKTITAAFQLIESLIHNQKYADAEKCAFNLWEILNTNNHVDNDIPAGERESYIARGAQYYAQATFRLADSGGIPPNEKQQAGEEAITLARRAMEINIQLYGTDDPKVALSMQVLAQVLGCFISPDVDEVSRLYEQAIAIFSRKEGPVSVNVGASKCNLGNLYRQRAYRAMQANDLDQEHANLELALPPLLESVRIFRAINHAGRAEQVHMTVAMAQEDLRKNRVARAAATAAVSRG